MGTFSSETSANKHNSDKIETLIALQNDPRWLFLHSWFSKFPRGRSPGPPYKKRYTGKFGISFFCPTFVPRRHPTSLSSAHTDTKTLFARHLNDNLWFSDLWFYQQNYLSRLLFLLYYFCFCLDMVYCYAAFLLGVVDLFWFIYFFFFFFFFLIKQIFYWLVINCLKFYWLLICWTPLSRP